MTAMQELLKELERRFSIIESEPSGMVRETMIGNFLIDTNKYLELEKEQISQAFLDGYCNDEYSKTDSENYYDITFKS